MTNELRNKMMEDADALRENLEKEGDQIDHITVYVVADHKKELKSIYYQVLGKNYYKKTRIKTMPGTGIKNPFVQAMIYTISALLLMLGLAIATTIAHVKGVENKGTLFAEYLISVIGVGSALYLLFHGYENKKIMFLTFGMIFLFINGLGLYRLLI